MTIAHSKVTSQGQISVPAEIRKRLGVGPGSTLVWDEDGDRIVVRRAGLVSSEDIHQALFTERQPKQKSLRQLKQGIRDYARKHHARS